MKEVVICFFGWVEHQRGAIRRSVYEKEDTKVTIQSKTLYFGTNSKWKLKIKEISNLQVKEQSMMIETENERLTLNEAVDERQWQSFCKQIERIRQKYQSETSFSSFLHDSASKRLGHRRSSGGGPPVRKGRVYGKSAVRSAVYGKSDVGRSPAKLKDFSWVDPTFSDDDSGKEEEKHLVPSVEDKASDDKLQDTSKTIQDDSDTEDEIVQPPKTHCKRLKKLNDDDDHSDDDEDAFTTPAMAQRVVSPGGTTTQPRTALKSPASEAAVEKNQPTISSFFHPTNKEPTSVDAAMNKTEVVSTPAPTTPKRTPKITSASSSASQRLVRSAKRVLQHDSRWLEASSAGYSPIKSSAQKLFGNQKASWGKQQPDPLEEYDSSPDQARAPPSIAMVHKRRRISFPLKRPVSAVTASPVRANLTNELQTQVEAIVPALVTNPFRGLRNLGNTCYLNASLQMLYTVSPFIQALEGKGGPLTKSVVEVNRELEDDSYTFAVNPKDVKKAIDEKTDKFVGYEQRDAHEFLSDLVDHVHEELVEERKKKADSAEDNAEGEDLLPTDDFRLTLQVCLKCNSCGYTRTKDEIYRHLSVDIVSQKPEGEENETAISKASVENSLKAFFQPEVREIKCEKCTDGTHASQTLRILSRPKALVLHLKRFIVVEKPRPAPSNSGDENQPPNSPSNMQPVEYLFQKNKAPVLIPENMSLDKFMVKGDSDDEPSDTLQPASQYTIKSIVHHMGARASSGHYIADAVRLCDKEESEENPSPVKTKEPCWVTFDDSSSCKTSWEKIQSSTYKKTTAYLLLYTLSD